MVRSRLLVPVADAKHYLVIDTNVALHQVRNSTAAGLNFCVALTSAIRQRLSMECRS
jgi:hypothetical protein